MADLYALLPRVLSAEVRRALVVYLLRDLLAVILDTLIEAGGQVGTRQVLLDPVDFVAEVGVWSARDAEEGCLLNRGSIRLLLLVSLGVPAAVAVVGTSSIARDMGVTPCPRS